MYQRTPVAALKTLHVASCLQPPHDLKVPPRLCNCFRPTPSFLNKHPCFFLAPGVILEKQLNLHYLIFYGFCLYKCQWVMSGSLWLHGLSPARLLCPWNPPGKNTGVGCYFLLQRLNQGFLCCRQILYYKPPPFYNIVQYSSSLLESVSPRLEVPVWLKLSSLLFLWLTVYWLFLLIPSLVRGPTGKGEVRRTGCELSHCG